MALLPQNVTFQFANANIPASQQLKFNLSRMIRPLDFTSYAIPLALNIMMTAYSPFSQKDVRHFIFQLLKLFRIGTQKIYEKIMMIKMVLASCPVQGSIPCRLIFNAFRTLRHFHLQ